MTRFRLGLAFSAVVIAVTLLFASACLPGSGPALLGDQDSGSPSGLDLDDSGLTRSDVDLGDPFALEGLTPSHGPFTGGTRSQLSGRGFTSTLHVYLGNTEVPASDVLASDPTRAAIITPAGPPGFVDVRIVDDTTSQERVLPQAFYYDAFVVSPDTGATSGGTRITLTGSGTTWTTVGTDVAIGGVACTSVTVSSPTSLECITPAGAPGSNDVTVTTPDGVMLQARDAFTYSDSDDGYRGGLSGGSLAGTVRVLAFDSYTGAPIVGAKAIVGGNAATALVEDTATSGVAEFSGITDSAVTVTVAAKCHQPMTYIDVPVDTVTAYLLPVIDPSCAEGDPPSTGGGGGIYGGIIDGEIVFPGGAEFQKGDWSNVPLPTKPTERQAAYVFEVSDKPNESFVLPDPTEALTPDTDGTTGYAFSIVVFPGNVTLYVIAGLEDRSVTPPSFVPYSMGIVRGVSVPAETHVTGVDVEMDILFDHEVLMAPQAPTPGPRGPDRFQGTVAMTLGTAGFALLPLQQKIVTLPAPATIPFIGVPTLDHEAAGEQYVLTGVAATGVGLSLPASVVANVRTTDANDAVSLGGFLNVPELVEPASGSWAGTQVSFTGSSSMFDLSVINISSGSGLSTWTIVAPGGVTSFDVPDLAALSTTDRLGLIPGPITTTVYNARINAFSYGNMRQGQQSSSTWDAYAFDGLSGAY